MKQLSDQAGIIEIALIQNQHLGWSYWEQEMTTRPPQLVYCKNKNQSGILILISYQSSMHIWTSMYTDSIHWYELPPKYFDLFYFFLSYSF